MTWREYLCVALGYQQRQLEGWRQTRLLATLWVNTHRGENEPAVTPEEFMPLPGDAPTASTVVMSEDEFNRIAALYS